VDGSELLQTSHLSKAEHSAFSSSKRQVGILSPIVRPAARFLPIRVANNFHCSAIGTSFVRHNYFWPAIALHCFSEKFQCCLAVSALGNITFQHLTFVINGSPEVMCLSIYLYEDLVQVPLPVRIRSHPTDPVSSYLSSKHWAKSIPPKPNCFVADLNASFVQRIFHVTE
jgi:hypothetical protein